jgi:hypothetical protein
MDFFDLKEIEKIENRLLEVIKQEYENKDCYYLNVDSVNISYIENSVSAAIKIVFGKYDGGENGWQKEITLDYFNDNLDFIAGQFAQSIVNLGI